MNNKGFTLVELLAVMVILVSISLVTVGGISASLEKRDVKECEEQHELAIGAAKIYFSFYQEVKEVTIGQLELSGYLSSAKTDRLESTDVIKVTSAGYKHYRGEPLVEFKCD